MSQDGQAIGDLKAIRAAAVERRRAMAAKIASGISGPLSDEGAALTEDLAAMQASIEALDGMIADEEKTAPVSDMRGHMTSASRGSRTDVP